VADEALQRQPGERWLVLGLGNELLADDGVGTLAARCLRERLGARADVIESSLSGVALLDVIVGYDNLVIIDAIHTGRYPPGTIVVIEPAQLRPVESPSPHYAGLPELLELARRLDLKFPSKIRILAVEVQDMLTIGGAMTEAVAAAVDGLCDRVEQLVDESAQAPTWSA